MLNDIQKHNGFEDSVWGDRQVVPLPFKVENFMIHWKVLCYPTKDDRVRETCGAPQLFAVVTVTIMALESTLLRPKEKQKLLEIL